MFPRQRLFAFHISPWVRSKGYYLHSASYLGLHLDIDNGGRLKGKHFTKRVDFTFQMSISNSPVAIFQHHQRIEFTFHESRACPQYSDFLNRAKQLMQKLLKQGYVGHRLKPSLQTFYGCHHELVYRCEISFFLKRQWIFSPLCIAESVVKHQQIKINQSFLYHRQNLYRPWLKSSPWVFYKK